MKACQGKAVSCHSLVSSFNGVDSSRMVPKSKGAHACYLSKEIDGRTKARDRLNLQR